MSSRYRKTVSRLGHDLSRCPDWKIENPGKSLVASFNNTEFSFSSQKPYKLTIEEISREISSVWKIIQANLALEELVRVGVRFSYLLPTKSTDESEALIKRSKLNIVLPEGLQKDIYSIKNRQIIVVLSKDDTDYRVELAGVTRNEGLNPSELIRTDPRLLSNQQKQFRLEKLKQLNEYSANPMFAVHLNVDCSNYDLEFLSVEEYVLRQYEVVKVDFLPILNNL